MSGIVKSTPGKLQFKNFRGDIIREIPLTRITVYPKNKYSKVYQDMAKEKKEQEDKK